MDTEFIANLICASVLRRSVFCLRTHRQTQFTDSISVRFNHNACLCFNHRTSVPIPWQSEPLPRLPCEFRDGDIIVMISWTSQTQLLLQLKKEYSLFRGKTLWSTLHRECDNRVALCVLVGGENELYVVIFICAHLYEIQWIKNIEYQSWHFCSGTAISVVSKCNEIKNLKKS